MKHIQPFSSSLPKNTDIAALQAFVLHAQKQYGSGNIQLVKTEDGRKILTVENNNFKLTDEFDGGNPFCGIERLVSKTSNHVIWNGYYHGWLTKDASNTGATVETIFNFLRQALQNPSEETLLRGPKAYRANKLRYASELEFGTFNCFFGSEAIYDEKERLLYYGRYGGGVVDLVEDMGEA